MGVPDDSDPQEATRWYWQKFATTEKAVEAALNAKYPRQLKIIGASVEWIYNLFVSPAFAMVVSFLLVPLVVSEAISLTTWACVSAAWLVVVFGVARQPNIKRLSILKKIVTVVGVSAAMAILGTRYISFTLRSYYRHHPSQATDNSGEKVNDDLLAKRMKELFDSQIQKAIDEEHRKEAKATRNQPAYTPPVQIPTHLPTATVERPYSSLSTPELRFDLEVLAGRARGMANDFQQRESNIEGMAEKSANFLRPQDLTPEWRKSMQQQQAQERLTLLQDHSTYCSQLRHDAVLLITEVLSRERVLPLQPAPRCLVMGNITDGAQWTELQSYSEGIEKLLY